MSATDLDKSIYDQATALHKSDATLHAEPVTRKSSKSSKSVTTPTPKTPVATPAVPLPKTPVATPPVPLPGQPVAPPVNPYHALLSDLMSADTVKRQQMVTLIGKAILATKDDEALMVLWEVISADIDRIEVGNVPKLHANVA